MASRFLREEQTDVVEVAAHIEPFVVNRSPGYGRQTVNDEPDGLTTGVEVKAGELILKLVEQSGIQVHYDRLSLSGGRCS